LLDFQNGTARAQQEGTMKLLIPVAIFSTVSVTAANFAGLLPGALPEVPMLLVWGLVLIGTGRQLRGASEATRRPLVPSTASSLRLRTPVTQIEARV
jgi:hypothetical protein